MRWLINIGRYQFSRRHAFLNIYQSKKNYLKKIRHFPSTSSTSTTHHKLYHETNMVTPPPQRHHMSYMVSLNLYEIYKLINDPNITFTKVVYVKSINSYLKM